MRLSLNSMVRSLRGRMRRTAGFFVGVAFTIAAIAAIQYDETIAPKLSSLSDSLLGISGDVVRRLS